MYIYIYTFKCVYHLHQRYLTGAIIKCWGAFRVVRLLENKNKNYTFYNKLYKKSNFYITEIIITRQ